MRDLARPSNRSPLVPIATPRGQLSVQADVDTGKITGRLVFAPSVEQSVTGSLLIAKDDLPDGIELTAEGLGSVSTLRGYFIYGSVVFIAGVVVALRGDLAKQPVGTRGAFVLSPGIAG